MLEIKFKVAFFKFSSVFLAFARKKLFKLSLFGTKLGTQHYLVCIIVFNWLESRTTFISLTLRAKLLF